MEHLRWRAQSTWNVATDRSSQGYRRFRPCLRSTVSSPCAILLRLRVMPAYIHSNMRAEYSCNGSIKPFTATPQNTTTNAFAINLISGSVD